MKALEIPEEKWTRRLAKKDVPGFQALEKRKIGHLAEKDLKEPNKQIQKDNCLELQKNVWKFYILSGYRAPGSRFWFLKQPGSHDIDTQNGERDFPNIECRPV